MITQKTEIEKKGRNTTMTPKEALKILKEMQTDIYQNTDQAEAVITAIRFMEANPNAPTTYIARSVLELIDAMRDGSFKPKMGEVVLQLEDERSRWKIVDARMTEDGKHKITLMVTNVIGYAPFDRPNKEYPWGWNNYDESQIKTELLRDWLPILFRDERFMLHDREELGRLFLLSDEEVGFEQTDNTLEYFRDKDRRDLEERRQMKDMDGDSCHWWLRSPHPGHANSARYVSTSGALTSDIASNGRGAAPACEIIFQSNNPAPSGRGANRTKQQKGANRKA